MFVMPFEEPREETAFLCQTLRVRGPEWLEHTLCSVGKTRACRENVVSSVAFIWGTSTGMTAATAWPVRTRVKICSDITAPGAAWYGSVICPLSVAMKQVPYCTAETSGERCNE